MNFFSHTKYRFSLCVTGILLTAIAGVCVADGTSTAVQENPSSKIIARVNGEPIYEEQVDAVIQSRFGQSKYAQSLTDSPSEKIELQKKAIEKLIPSTLIYQESLKLTIADAENKIDQLIKTFKNHPLGHYDNKSDAQLREMAKRQVFAGEYFKVNNLYSPTISDAEIKKYYEENKSSFVAKKDSVHVRHIIVQCTDKMSPTEKEKALNRIQEAREKIIQENDFSEIAKEYSEDNSANSGGDIGFINRGYMPQEFDSVAFNIETGKISKVIKTSFGYHVLEVLEIIHKGETRPYEKLKDFFAEFLQRQKSKEVIDQHILALRKKAVIEIYLENL